MRLSFSSNLAEFIGQMKEKRKQLEFATALALTRTAQVVSRESPAFLERQLDRPTPFTKRGLYVKPARRGDLVAIVGYKDVQAQYLSLQEQGGARAPRRRTIVLPSNVARDQYGNVPPLQLRRLYERAKGDKRATKALGKRLGISNKVDLFVGEPGEGFPPGIYKRVTGGLVPIVVFREQAVRYRPRLGWTPWATRRAGEA